MIRPFTFSCMVLAGVAGLLLYQTKHETQMLDRQIMAVLKQTDLARDRIGAMQAELSLLSQTDRLKELSEKHLGLQTLSLAQFASIADLGSRLPPPGLPASTPLLPEEAPATAPPLNTPIAAVPMAPAATAAPLRTAAKPPAPLPAPPAMASLPVTLPGPAQLAAAAPPRPPRPAPPRPAAGREDPVVVHLPPAAAAGPTMAPAPVRPLAPVVSIGAAPIQVARPAPPPRAPSYDTRTAVALPASLPAAAFVQPAPMQPYAPVQSALGGARPLLPPPVPYAAQAH